MMRMLQTVLVAATLLALSILASQATEGEPPGKKGKPLSEADLVGLIVHCAQDQPILKRLEKTGLGFQLDEATLARLKQANPSPAVLAALENLLAAKGAAKEPADAAWQVLGSGVKDDLHSITFINDKIGVAVGGSYTILRTSDGGKSWKRVLGPKSQSGYFASVIFADDKVGWVRNNYNSETYRTDDGGLTWQQIALMPKDAPPGSPSSVYNRHGFSDHAVVGNTYFHMNWYSNVSGNFLSVTSDRGKTWTDLAPTSDGKEDANSASISFAGAKEGWKARVMGAHPHTHFVSRSSDGGTTWKSQQIKDKVAGRYMIIRGVDKDNGFFVSETTNHIHVSTDGGKTWTPHQLGNGLQTRMRVMQFLDAKTGYLLCGDDDYHVRKTADGGKTWTSLGSLKRPIQDTVRGLHFRPDGTGFVVGDKGYIACFGPGSKANPDSVSAVLWEVRDSGVKDTLHSVAFANEQVGVAVGAKRTVVRTTDGGKSWKRAMKPLEEDDYLASVIFANEKLGYIHGGYTGNLHRTKDGGATWEPFVNPNPSGLYSIKGFATHAAFGNSYFWMNYAGYFSSLALYKTEDAKTWAHLWDHDNHTLGGSGARMVFVSATEGWMASGTHPGAKFWVGRSSDGGKTWTAQEVKEKVRGGYMLIAAVDKDHGWFCSQWGNFLHASSDGGKTWTAHDLGTGALSSNLHLQFLDAKTGYLLCGTDYHVRRTLDGGKTWHSLGKLNAPGAVYGMSFTRGGRGIVVGEKGYVAVCQVDARR